MKTWKVALLAAGVLFVLAAGTSLILFLKYQGWRNMLVSLEEGTKAAWSEVENHYQRRYDLIPNLVETVKGYAKHENETLEEVAKARAQMGGMLHIPPDALKDPATLERYRQAQASLGGALQRLMMVTERYPDLKANQNFMDLQSQLEGTENRISVARRRFNEAAKTYNEKIRQFPYYFIAGRMGLKATAYFEGAEGTKEAPKVKF